MSVRSKKLKFRLALVLVALLTVYFGIGAMKSAVPADKTYDVVIANGRVMDPESGFDAIRNVGISGGKILAISNEPLKGKQVIDAKGLVVAPGFIDLHEHGQEPRNYQYQARDGVTTSLELEAGTADVNGWYAAREGKSLINFGVSIGHIPVRRNVLTKTNGEHGLGWEGKCRGDGRGRCRRASRGDSGRSHSTERSIGTRIPKRRTRGRHGNQLHARSFALGNRGSFSRGGKIWRASACSSALRGRERAGNWFERLGGSDCRGRCNGAPLHVVHITSMGIRVHAATDCCD